MIGNDMRFTVEKIRLRLPELAQWRYRYATPCGDMFFQQAEGTDRRPPRMRRGATFGPAMQGADFRRRHGCLVSSRQQTLTPGLRSSSEDRSAMRGYLPIHLPEKLSTHP
jgi:hypothetical protein